MGVGAAAGGGKSSGGWWHDVRNGAGSTIRHPALEVVARSGGQTGRPGSADGNPLADTPAGPRFYHLVLTSGSAADEAGSADKVVRLHRVTALTVGRLVSLLYIPTGPIGTKDRYVLVFPSVAERDAAARAVAEFDVSTVVPSLTAMPSNDSDLFPFGVGVCQAELLGDAPEVSALTSAQDALAKAADLPDQSAYRRWIAAMLSGWLAADRFENRDKGLLLFQKAEQLARPRSVEAGEAIYAQYRLQSQAGRAEAARVTLGRLKDSCGHLGRTELMERAVAMPQGPGGKRP